MAQRALTGVMLFCRGQLLAQVGGGIDEIPVLAIGTESDRCLRALKFRRFVPGGPANLAAAIPLRYATARRSAKDVDAKHDPSPGKPASLLSNGYSVT